MGPPKLALGIDLGTTNSSCAAFREGRVDVLENRLGEVLTPSVVGLESGSGLLLVGRPAKELLSLHPDHAAATFKRSMGRERVYRVGEKDLGAVELSACVLRALLEDAERGLGCRVTECVITVPAYFDEEQRYATMKAGELAGLEVLRVLNEPTAAAMAHGLHEQEKDSRFLVFDLGGGTFDVCIMERFAGVLQVKSTAGESRLGGEDFTRRLVSLALNEVGLSYEQVEQNDLPAIGLLLKRSELAKRRLTDVEEVDLVVPRVRGLLDRDVAVKVTRDLAESAWKTLVRRLHGPCRQALRGARLQVTDLDEIILVGGATRMPMVRTLVQHLFEMDPVAAVDADLAVVHGAAIQAALCQRHAEVEDIVVTDVLSHSLGIDVSKKIGGHTISGYFSPIIHRNTVIPTSRTESFETLEPNQRQVQFDIYEGESRRVQENRLIGSLTVKGIPMGPPGQRVDIRFTYDLNAILEVEARVDATGRVFSKLFHRESKNLSGAAMERAQERIARLKEDPRAEPRVKDLLLRAESLWRDLPPESRSILEHAIDEFEEQLEGHNPDAIKEGFERLAELCERIDGGDRW